MALNNVLKEKYKKVFDETVAQKELAKEHVEKSKFFFSFNGNGRPVPKRFDTYGIVCCLPFPAEFQQILEDLWREFLKILNNPLSYGAEPANRHVEIFLFQRPEESFGEDEIKEGIKYSLETAKTMKPFKIKFSYPFVTPDGTIVVPGYDFPEGAVDSFRGALCRGLKNYPKKQSQWLHTSLGRILEPIDRDRLSSLLSKIENNWGKSIGEIEVKEILWTYEKQWYMLDRVVLKQFALK